MVEKDKGMKLLEVKGLTKKFAGLVANDSLDLEIDQGEIVGLIGPNGSGKTTFFNCICGVYPVTKGSVRYEGREITNFPAHKICKGGIARTFQLVNTLMNMTALENVMVGAFCRTTNTNRAREIAEELLEFAGLPEKKDILGSDLTIADKKRLEVARALATKPRLLLLDEAMAGLNPTEQKEAVELIRRIQREGITLLVVEHVMQVIMPLCERVVVLDAGKKIAADVPERIANDERVIKAYLGERYYAKRATLRSE